MCNISRLSGFIIEPGSSAITSIGGFMRFVFRRSGALIGVYVGLVLAYGALGFTQSAITVNRSGMFLIGVITASALFIFITMDSSGKSVKPRRGRCLASRERAPASLVSAPLWPAWARHGLRWAALVIPFGALCAAQLLGRVVPPLERTAKVAEVFRRIARRSSITAKLCMRPAAWRKPCGNMNLPSAAILLWRKPSFFLGLAWKDLGELDRAQGHYERSLTLDPRNGKSESILPVFSWRRGPPCGGPPPL